MCTRTTHTFPTHARTPYVIYTNNKTTPGVKDMYLTTLYGLRCIQLHMCSVRTGRTLSSIHVPLLTGGYSYTTIISFF